MADMELAAISSSMSTLVDDTIRQAGDITITSQHDLDTLGAFLTTVLRPMMAQVEETFDPVVKAAHLAHKQAVAARDKHAKPLIELKGRIDTAIGRYHRQKQIEREQEAKRIEAAAQAEARQLLLDQANDLIEAGNTDAAVDVLAAIDEPTSYGASTLPAIRTPPKTAGVSVRETWAFEMVDANKLNREFLVADEVAIRKVVTAMGEKAVAVVGSGSIRVYKRTSVASTAR